MISYVQIVTVWVSDQERALDFYVNRLGFEKRSDEQFGPGMRWLEAAPPGGQTSITLASGFGGEDWATRIGVDTGIVFDTPDIDATYETLRERGVEFIEPPTMQPWGMKQALFVDQDRNGFVLVERSSHA